MHATQVSTLILMVQHHVIAAQRDNTPLQLIIYCAHGVLAVAINLLLDNLLASIVKPVRKV